MTHKQDFQDARNSRIVNYAVDATGNAIIEFAETAGNTAINFAKTASNLAEAAANVAEAAVNLTEGVGNLAYTTGYLAGAIGNTAIEFVMEAFHEHVPSNQEIFHWFGNTLEDPVVQTVQTPLTVATPLTDENLEHLAEALREDTVNA